jgi:hypothetical protein
VLSMQTARERSRRAKPASAATGCGIARPDPHSGARVNADLSQRRLESGDRFTPVSDA